MNLIKATDDVILFPQIWRNFSNIASISIDILRSTRSKRQMLTAYLNKISCNPFGCGRFFVRVNLIIFKKAWFIYI